MLRRLVTLVGPLIATLTLTPAAAAGPMSWTYKAIVEAGDGSYDPPAAAVLRLGRFPSETSGSLAAVYSTAPLPTGSSGSGDGSGTLVLAASSKGSYTDGPSLPAGAVDSFRTLLEITDGTSGARGYTYMNGRGELVPGTDGSGEVRLSGQGRVQIDLGGNRYDLTWHPDETESVSRIVVDVSVSSIGDAGPTTPEPATLALAGLGLGVIGLRRLRK